MIKDRLKWGITCIYLFALVILLAIWYMPIKFPYEDRYEEVKVSQGADEDISQFDLTIPKDFNIDIFLGLPKNYRQINSHGRLAFVDNHNEIAGPFFSTKTEFNHDWIDDGDWHWYSMASRKQGGFKELVPNRRYQAIIFWEQPFHNLDRSKAYYAQLHHDLRVSLVFRKKKPRHISIWWKLAPVTFTAIYWLLAWGLFVLLKRRPVKLKA